MEGRFSWLVLIAAFAAVTVLCGFLAARLLRIGSGERPAGETRAPDLGIGRDPK